MLPKKYSHFLLASTLMLTGIYATATEEQAPLKTAEQQAHADSLLKAIDLFKDELLAAGIRAQILKNPCLRVNLVNLQHAAHM